jgi:hypothetical protein
LLLAFGDCPMRRHARDSYQMCRRCPAIRRLHPADPATQAVHPGCGTAVFGCLAKRPGHRYLS